MLHSVIWDEAGQALTENALIILFIALAVVVVLVAMGGKLGSTFQRIVDTFV